MSSDLIAQTAELNKSPKLGHPRYDAWARDAISNISLRILATALNVFQDQWISAQSMHPILIHQVVVNPQQGLPSHASTNSIPNNMPHTSDDSGNYRTLDSRYG